MYTHEELIKQSRLGGYMTGTIMGFIKYSELSEREKKSLAKQLIWCYETSGTVMPESVSKEIQEILSA